MRTGNDIIYFSTWWSDTAIFGAHVQTCNYAQEYTYALNCVLVAHYEPLVCKHIYTHTCVRVNEKIGRIDRVYPLCSARKCVHMCTCVCMYIERKYVYVCIVKAISHFVISVYERNGQSLTARISGHSELKTDMLNYRTFYYDICWNNNIYWTEIFAFSALNYYIYLLAKETTLISLNDWILYKYD